MPLRKAASLCHLIQQGCIGDTLFFEKLGVSLFAHGNGLIVQELAPGTVGAVELLVEPLALLGLVVAGLVLPLFELMGTVSK